MFKRYPDTYRMRIFPTRRSANLPDIEYERIREDAVNTGLADGGNGLLNFRYSVPFPIPESGVEAIWNHVTRYRNESGLKRRYTQIPVQANGSFAPVLFEDESIPASRLPDNEYPNRLFVFLQRVLAPARLEGDVLLVHENIDQVKEPRKAWIYNAGQRRVRLAPNIAYDGPGTASDGLRTADDLDMFNGTPDRYDWELVGKREMYIPYNSYDLRRGDLKYKDIVNAGHMNPRLPALRVASGLGCRFAPEGRGSAYLRPAHVLSGRRQLAALFDRSLRRSRRALEDEGRPLHHALSGEGPLARGGVFARSCLRPLRRHRPG